MLKSASGFRIGSCSGDLTPEADALCRFSFSRFRYLLNRTGADWFLTEASLY